MNVASPETKGKMDRKAEHKGGKSKRVPGVLAAGAIVALIIGYTLWRPLSRTNHQAKAPAVESTSHETERPESPASPPAVQPAPPVLPAIEPALHSAKVTGGLPDTNTPPLAIQNPGSQQLVAALARVDQAGTPMTVEQIAEWKQNLQKLVGVGRQSVPAIVEFLKKNQDVEFGPSGTTALGYSSARRAMFDALAQIGGPEGSAALVQTLQDSADPREIAALADHLNKVGPGEHTAEILQATRDVLGMAASGKLPDEDVGPLFEVLQKNGEQSVSAELEKSSDRWKYYSAMALANLPNGAGIPSLVKMLDDNSGNKLTALQMLAQVANQYPEARAALLEQARGNKITPNNWPYLSDALAGREYHYSNSEEGTGLAPSEDVKSTSIKFGNQNFYTVPSPSLASPDFVDGRLGIINDLKSVTSDAAGIKALEQSQLELTARLSKISAK